MKKIKTSCLIAYILCVFSAITCFANNQLILDLHFDEGNGSKTANSADPLCVCLQKKDPEWVTGYRGKALKFSKPGQHVRILSQKTKIPLKSFTFECWIKPEQISGIRCIFIGPGTKLFHYGFDVALKNGYPMLRYSTKKNKRNVLIANSQESKLLPSVFSHIAIVYDNKKVKIFVNGNLVLDKEISSPIIFKGSGKILVVSPYTRPEFNGVIDELKFYTRALSNDEVKEHSGKSFSFAFSPSKNNKGQPKTKKWYFLYDHTRPVQPRNLNRNIGFTGKPYDRFTEDENKTIFFDIKNLTDKNGKIKLVVKIDDWQNKEVKSEIFDLSIPAKKGVKQKINLDTEKNGCFILVLEVLKDGEKLFSTSKPYAVTVTPDKNIAGKERPFGHHMHDGVWNNRVMPETASSNVRFWQGTTNWAQIERKKGEFTWEASDYLVNSCYKKGQKILYTLAYTPAWASSAPELEKKPPWHIIYRYPPKDVKDWENFVRKVVRRYKDKVKYWEIWNETDSSYFRGTPEEYLEMLKSAYKAIKEEDPSAKVVGIAGTSQWYDFTKKIFELGGYKYMDILSVHFYLNNTPEKGRLLPSIKAAKDLIKNTGKEMQLWDTESSYASPLRQENGRMYDVPAGTTVILPYTKGHKKHKTFGERLTSAYFVRQWILEIVNGVDKFFLFDQYCMPKGVYPLCLVSYEAMVKNIADNKFNRNIPLGQESLYGYLFSGDKNVAVLWSAGAVSDVFLNCHADKVQVVDFMGNSREVNAKSPVKVTLNDYPVYIVGCGKEIELAGQPLKFSSESKATIGSEFAVKIKNISDKNAKFTATLLNAQYKTFKNSTATENIEAGKEKTLSLTVPKGTAEGDAYVMIEMAGDKDKSFMKTSPIRIINPPIAINNANEGNVVVDGNLEEWTNSDKMFLNKEDQVKIGRKNEAFIGVAHWEGVNDLSGVFAGRWTNKGLYMAFDVTDNNILPSSDKKAYYKGDCIELFLDLRNKDNLGNAAYEDGIYHLILVPGKDADDKTICVSASFSGTHKGYEKLLPAVAPGEQKRFFGKLFSGSSDSKIVVAGKRTLRGYAIEIFIPLLPELSFKEPFEDERVIGFDIAIDDADKGENNNKRKTQMIYNGTTANHRDASNFATLKLTKEKSN